MHGYPTINARPLTMHHSKPFSSDKTGRYLEFSQSLRNPNDAFGIYLSTILFLHILHHTCRQRPPGCTLRMLSSCHICCLSMRRIRLGSGLGVVGWRSCQHLASFFFHLHLKRLCRNRLDGTYDGARITFVLVAEFEI